MFLEVALLLLTAIVFLLYYLLSFYNFWDKYGIPVLKPKYPLFGNDFEFTFSLNTLHGIQEEAYNSFSKDRFFGSFKFLRPTIILRDPDLVEAVTVKDFSYFVNRGNADDPRATVISAHLLNARDAHWKALRNKLTPTFSSGKLKGMHGQLLDCADSLVWHMETLGREPFETRDVAARFTTDVIASCAFGLNADTINDPNSMFRKFGKAVFKFSVVRKLKTALRRALVPVFRFIKFNSSIPADLVEFFIATVNQTLEHRKENNIVRPDFLHLTNELCEKDRELVAKGQLDRDDPHIFDHTALVSNAFAFFVAGFETTSNTLSKVLYELALNEEIQNKLHSEVVAVIKRHGCNLSYDAVQEMSYAEQVILETLRLHPPVVEIARILSKEYRLPGSDMLLPPGTEVSIPIYSLQHDPQYFPEPNTFNPERFSDGEESIRKGTFLPFGYGPRICIGARFAKLELKVALAKVLLKYKILKCSKTEVPLTYDKGNFLMVPENGIWVAIEPRMTTSDIS